MNTATPDSSRPSNPALSPLRAIYRAARAGSTIDPQALVAALGAAVCAGADVTPVLLAFEPLAFVWTSRLGGPDGAYLCRAALEQGGWHAALRMASLLGWSDVWAAAMTAHYGPTGTHTSRLGADGRPTAETLAEFPRMAERMAEAAERFELVVGWYERNLRATRWHEIVESKAPRAMAA